MRRNVCIPIPKTEDMAELNQKLREKREKYLQLHIRRKSASVGKLLDIELRALQPLPGYVYNAAMHTSGIVDYFCTVRFDINNDSVSCAYRRKEVAVTVDLETLEVFYAGQVIASHRCCFEQKPCRPCENMI
ncbi:MAG: hypothetical protein J6C37_06280 [Roseburia sp.]|nr:hypothetical protein [Roseburia sp.]